jgi:hypothetical protein
VKFELQFDGLSNVLGSNHLKDSVVFGEYPNKLLVLRLSKACDIIYHVFKAWFIIIIW